MVLNIDMREKRLIIKRLGGVVLGGFEKGEIFIYCGPQAVASPSPADQTTAASNLPGSEKYSISYLSMKTIS